MPEQLFEFWYDEIGSHHTLLIGRLQSKKPEQCLLDFWNQDQFSSRLRIGFLVKLWKNGITASLL